MRLEPDEDQPAARINIEQLKASCTTQFSVGQHYERMAQFGLNYGPAFQGITQIWRGRDEVLGEVILPDDMPEENQGFLIHPALLDACLQLLGAATSPSIDQEIIKFMCPLASKPSNYISLAIRKSGRR